MDRKYCIGCAKFQGSPSGTTYGRCGDDRAADIPGAEKFLSPDFDKTSQKYATTVRSTDSLCGPGATWFQPKVEE